MLRHAHFCYEGRGKRLAADASQECSSVEPTFKLALIRVCLAAHRPSRNCASCTQERKTAICAAPLGKMGYMFMERKVKGGLFALFVNSHRRERILGMQTRDLAGGCNQRHANLLLHDAARSWVCVIFGHRLRKECFCHGHVQTQVVENNCVGLGTDDVQSSKPRQCRTAGCRRTTRNCRFVEIADPIKVRNTVPRPACPAHWTSLVL
jgi:hypothetical protein